MILKSFLYFLTDQEGRSYRVNNGNVEVTGTPEPLPITPDGWQEISLRWGRSQKYSGLFRSFTLPLRFVKQAGRILLHRFYNAGYEDKVFLVIQRLDRSFGNGWYHKLFYTGELDLSKLEQDETGVTCNVIEGGADKNIKAFEDATYEIDLPETIQHDGVTILSIGVMNELALEVDADFPIWYVPLVAVRNSDFGFVVTGQSSAGLNGGYQYFVTNPYDDPVEVRLAGTFSINVPEARNYSFIIAQRNTITNDLVSIIVNSGLINAADYSISLDLVPTITLQPGEGLSMTIDGIYSVGPGGPDDPAPPTKVFFLDNNIEVRSPFRYKTTFVKAINPIQLGDALIKKMCGNDYKLESSYLSAEWTGLKITSGDAIRGVSEAKLKTSFSAFFTSINAVCNVALFIKGKTVYIERKAVAYQNTPSLDLGEVRDIKVKLSDEYLFNTLKIGYPDIDLEDNNGRYEFNVTQNYTTAVTRVKKELNLVSQYKASMYEIEFARIKLYDNSTRNSETDNTAYFIHCEPVPYYDEPTDTEYFKILRKAYDSITGLFDPASSYNIEISPKRNLLRHGDYIRACLYFQQSGGLIFQSSERNADLVTINDGSIISDEERIAEKDNVDIPFLADPLFIPLQFTFECPAPLNLVNVMDETPHNAFAFKYNGAGFKGFPLEVGIEPANRPAQESTLLASPDTDLSALIEIS